MIDILPHVEGCVLHVRAQPGARKQGVIGAHAGALKVAVTARPERGKANKAIIEVLARALGLKRSQIDLLSGETSPDKRFVIRGLAPDALRQRIDQIGSRG